MENQGQDEQNRNRQRDEAFPDANHVEQPDDPLLYIMNGTSLRTKLLNAILQMEQAVKKVLRAIFATDIEQTEREKLFSEGSASYTAWKIRFSRLLEFVEPHQQREDYSHILDAYIEDRDATIAKFAQNLIKMEECMQEVSLQANRRLRIANRARQNPVHVTDVVQSAFHLSRGNSISAPLKWVYGDPSRPFPVNVDFANSQLMTMQVQRSPLHHGTLSVKCAPTKPDYDSDYESDEDNEIHVTALSNLHCRADVSDGPQICTSLMRLATNPLDYFKKNSGIISVAGHESEQPQPAYNFDGATNAQQYNQNNLQDVNRQQLHTNVYHQSYEMQHQVPGENSVSNYRFCSSQEPDLPRNPRNSDRNLDRYTQPDMTDRSLHFAGQVLKETAAQENRRMSVTDISLSKITPGGNHTTQNPPTHFAQSTPLAIQSYPFNENPQVRTFESYNNYGNSAPVHSDITVQPLQRDLFPLNFQQPAMTPFHQAQPPHVHHPQLTRDGIQHEHRVPQLQNFTPQLGQFYRNILPHNEAHQYYAQNHITLQQRQEGERSTLGGTHGNSQTPYLSQSTTCQLSYHPQLAAATVFHQAQLRDVVSQEATAIDNSGNNAKLFNVSDPRDVCWLSQRFPKLSPEAPRSPTPPMPMNLEQHLLTHQVQFPTSVGVPNTQLIHPAVPLEQLPIVLRRQKNSQQTLTSGATCAQSVRMNESTPSVCSTTVLGENKQMDASSSTDIQQGAVFTKVKNFV